LRANCRSAEQERNRCPNDSAVSWHASPRSIYTDRGSLAIARPSGCLTAKSQLVVAASGIGYGARRRIRPLHA
jgi:hypothetical protein